MICVKLLIAQFWVVKIMIKLLKRVTIICKTWLNGKEEPFVRLDRHSMFQCISLLCVHIIFRFCNVCLYIFSIFSFGIRVSLNPE